MIITFNTRAVTLLERILPRGKKKSAFKAFSFHNDNYEFMYEFLASTRYVTTKQCLLARDLTNS